MDALYHGPTDSGFADWATGWLLSDLQLLPFRRSYDQKPWRIAAKLIAHLSSCCSEGCFRALENSLLDFHEPRLLPHYRYRHKVTTKIGLTFPSRAGATPYHLLPHLDAKRRSPPAERRIQELKRKFDPALDRYPPMFQEVGEIGGSVGVSQGDALRRINDRGWHKIIRNKKASASPFSPELGTISASPLEAL